MRFDRLAAPAFFFLSSALLAAACSGALPSPSEATTSGSDELIGGAPGVAAGTPVVYIAGGCTAVMIGNNMLLTAAHCVVDEVSQRITTTLSSGYHFNDPIAISSSNTIGAGTTWFSTRIGSTSLHPSFSAACSGGCPRNLSLLPPYPLDLAIITIQGKFPSSLGLAAVPAPVLAGTIVSEMGYGCEANVNTAPTTPPTFKVAQATVLDGSSATPFLKLPTDPAFFQRYFATLGVKGGGLASLCPGDSGGPVFNGQFAYGGFVVGINAFYTFNDASGVSAANVFVRLGTPEVVSWITNVYLDNHVGGSYGPGCDPTANGYDDCAGAQIMCSVGRKVEYLTLARRCETYGGNVPPCAFADAATVCENAAMACAARDADSWQSLQLQCSGLGGTVPPCDLPTPIHLIGITGGSGGSGSGGHSGSGSGGSGGHTRE